MRMHRPHSRPRSGRHGYDPRQPREYTSYGWKQDTRRSHWGIELERDEPTTGVYNSNDLEYVWDEITNGIDLGWEEHLAECQGMCSRCRCNHAGNRYGSSESGCDCHFPLYSRHEDDATSPDHAYDPIEGEHERCGPDEQGDTLFGSWKKVGDQWEPDRGGEYSAIYRSNSYTVQVVWSRHTVRAPLASPCYPGQCSVTPGKEGDPESQLAYAMPPEIVGEIRR